MKKQFLSFLLLLSFAFSVAAQTKEARLFDEFGNLPCDETQARLQNLATEIAFNNNSVALIYIYEGKHQIYDKKEKYILPRVGESVARTQTMKNLMNRLKLDQKNFIFASGGFREKYWVEVWIVPKGAKLPKATPTLETTKYRKGTAGDICGEY